MGSRFGTLPVFISANSAAIVMPSVAAAGWPCSGRVGAVTARRAGNSHPAQAARPSQELRRTRRLSRTRRPVRGAPAQRRAVNVSRRSHHRPRTASPPGARSASSVFSRVAAVLVWETLKTSDRTIQVNRLPREVAGERKLDPSVRVGKK